MVVVYWPCVAKPTSRASVVRLIFGRCVALLRTGVVSGMVVRAGKVTCVRVGVSFWSMGWCVALLWLKRRNGGFFFSSLSLMWLWGWGVALGFFRAYFSFWVIVSEFFAPRESDVEVGSRWGASGVLQVREVRPLAFRSSAFVLRVSGLGECICGCGVR